MEILQSISTSKIFALFTFILIISGNFLGQIFPCKLQYQLNHDMYLKHLFGLFTMIFFVVISSPDNNDNPDSADKTLGSTISSASILYVMFLLIAKVPFTIFYIIFILLGGTYLITLHKQNLFSNMIKNNNTQKNDTLMEIKKYDQIITYMYIAVFIFMFFGVISYMNNKKLEYKGKFDYITFFLGKTTCKSA